MKNKIILSSIFLSTLLLIIVLSIVSVVRTNNFNDKHYVTEISGSDLFTIETNKDADLSVNIARRSETWGKIFDFDNEGIEENNYFSHIYDFYFKNNTKYEVKKFSFKFTFSNEAYLASGWNGAVEIHQAKNGGEVVALIPDLREYDSSLYDLETHTVEDLTIIAMREGDYFTYIPSRSSNALEMPIRAHEGTVPGFIMYVKVGDSIEDSSIVLEYDLHKVITQDAFFLSSMIGLIVWATALVVIIITSFQIRKYKLRHDRDNEIINESIETFTGFIDAKDKYTNGHSKRVAIYTKQIAERLGYTGEELDRIYYIALLHDCGKIGVPDNILGKPGKLTDEEFEIIKSHTKRGGEILSSFKSLKNAGEGAMYHHERYDGKGYPEGLSGENIPLIARMICVADSFDAMNSNRVYRKKISKEYIINELQANKWTQFDPRIADIMLELINEGKIKIED